MTRNCGNILSTVVAAALLAGCKSCPTPGFPRQADVAAIVAPRPKIPPAALDPQNATAAANYQSADRDWGRSVSDAGGRICRALVAMGMVGVSCPEGAAD